MHAGRFHRLVRVCRASLRRRPLPFHFQQLTLALQAPSISTEMPRRANRAMAWDDNRHRIRAIGGADGADCARPSDSPGDFGIRARFARGNRAELLPHRELKRSAADIHRRRRHLRPASYVRRERTRPFADTGIAASNRRAGIITAQLRDQRAICFAYRGEADSAPRPCYQQAAERRIDNRIRDFSAGAARPV
jgi:hypothetical protein